MVSYGPRVDKSNFNLKQILISNTKTEKTMSKKDTKTKKNTKTKTMTIFVALQLRVIVDSILNSYNVLIHR